jgi:hypothetical protein
VLAAPASSSGGRSWLVVAAGLLAAAALAGAGVAAILSTRDEEPGATPKVVTQTLPGTTVRETVQTTVPAHPQPPRPAPNGRSGQALTDDATARLGRRDWAGAEALARQAVQKLQGGGDRLYLAYALYDLGRALAEQRRCEEAVPLLDRSERLQGRRTDIDRARRKCRVR